jgi:hypothetical protein
VLSSVRAREAPPLTVGLLASEAAWSVLARAAAAAAGPTCIAVVRDPTLSEVPDWMLCLVPAECE